MTPRILTVNPSHPEPSLIEEAGRIICEGGLVAFPTETVYGLAADATNPGAIERLNRVKGRPPEKPYSIHLYDPAQILSFVEAVPPLASRLMERFWPGPLTIVMPAKGRGSVGFRLPSHPVAQALLRRCQRPVVAPSANRSGFPPPTDAREALEALDGQAACVLDAGPTPIGRESTVVSVLDGRLEILREGAIAPEALRAAVA
ncbi:MAG: threonylcarbamoyl-AMP synthase [Candidatus Omnitrophica bacterium]|nr:threonylcarbamoyl-AMP synthase [Candidatus Omnitrophota bacterium]